MSHFRVYFRAIAATLAALAITACSSPHNGLVPDAAGKTAKALPIKTMTQTYKPFAEYPASAATTSKYGITKWYFYAWDDRKTVTVTGQSNQGEILWELDVTAQKNASGQLVGSSELQTSNGNHLYEAVPNGAIYNYGNGSKLDGPIAQAMNSDVHGWYGVDNGGRPSGPIAASAARHKMGDGQICNPRCETEPFDIMAFCVSAADVLATVAEVGVAAVTPAGWIALAIAGAVVAIDVYNDYSNSENSEPPSYGDPGTDFTGPGSGGGSGGSGTVTKVCVSDNLGNVQCWYTFY